MENNSLAYRQGDIIASLYQVNEVYKGGMGEVYIAYNLDRNELFALKTILPAYFYTYELYQQFRQEAESWILMGKHPNIVHALSVRNFEGHLFIILEYCRPDPVGRIHLSDFFCDSLINDYIYQWVLEFCKGYNFSLASGMAYHGDIKPSNIFITRNRHLKITDFGFSKFGRRSINTDILENLQPLYPYRAPELFEGAPQDILSDIFSFGVVLYQSISGGNLPFPDLPGDFINCRSYWSSSHHPVPIQHTLYEIVTRCLTDRLHRIASFELLEDQVNSLLTNSNVKIQLIQTPNLTSEEMRDLAIAQYELGKLDLAIANIFKVIEEGLDDEITYNLLGLFKFAYGKIDEAEEALKISVEKYEGYWASHLNLGLVYLAMDRLSDSIEQFNIANECKPTSQAYNNLGICYKRIFQESKTDENFKISLQHFRNAIILDRNYRDAHINLADLYKDIGDFENALIQLKEAHRIDPYDETLSSIFGD